MRCRRSGRPPPPTDERCTLCQVGRGRGGRLLPGVAMSVELNHTIVRVRDKHEAASFFAEILGLPPATTFGPFRVLEVSNHVSLDFADDHGPPVPAHYAFLVSEDEFDQIFERIKERGLPYWADPFHRH